MSYSLVLPDWPADEPEVGCPCFFCGEEVLPTEEYVHESFPIGIVHAECSDENEAALTEACCQCGQTDVYIDPTTELCDWCEDSNARDDSADSALEMYFEESA